MWPVQEGQEGAARGRARDNEDLEGEHSKVSRLRTQGAVDSRLDTKEPGFLTREWLCAKAGRPSMAGSSVVQASLEAPYICSVLGPAYVMASGKGGCSGKSALDMFKPPGTWGRSLYCKVWLLNELRGNQVSDEVKAVLCTGL